MLKFHDHLGVDIGSRSIKLIQVTPSDNDRYRLVAFGQIDAPKDKAGGELEAAKIEALKKLVADTRASSRQVVVGLPESQVYTRVIEMPSLPEAELAQAIRWQAEQYIPVSLEDVVLKHQVISQIGGTDVSAEGKVSVLLVAAPNLLLKSYTEIFNRVGLEIVAIETEILAVARSLIGGEQISPATLLVHMGAETTIFTILVKGELVLTQSVSSGGEAITRAIATSLGMDPVQAEGYKQTYGLDETKLEGKVADAIKPVMEIILTELKKVLAFYETRSGHDPVKRVILSGGTALMPGLVHYFTENLNLEVQEGNPFTRVDLNDKQKQAIAEKSSIFATAAGLALKPT